MFTLTAENYDLDKYQEDDMNARGLRFRQVSPAVKAMAERLSKEPPFSWEPKLTGLDRTVLAAKEEA
jgi:hypothetical protein